MMTRVRGVRLAIDVGTVRIGVAVSDPDGILASPVTTVARDLADGADVDTLAELVAEYAPVEVLVGFPRTLRGEVGRAAESVATYAAALALRIEPVPVRLVDERLSTVVATKQLRASGRTSRSARSVVDQAAAVAILQGDLDGAR